MRTKLALASALAAAAALFSPATAHADDAQDEALWRAFMALGVAAGPKAPQIAHTICKWAWNGTDLDDISNEVYQNNDVSYDQAEGMVAASILIYCPPAGVKTNGRVA